MIEKQELKFESPRSVADLLNKNCTSTTINKIEHSSQKMVGVLKLSHINDREVIKSDPASTSIFPNTDKSSSKTECLSSRKNEGLPKLIPISKTQIPINIQDFLSDPKKDFVSLSPIRCSKCGSNDNEFIDDSILKFPTSTVTPRLVPVTSAATLTTKLESSQEFPALSARRSDAIPKLKITPRISETNMNNPNEHFLTNQGLSHKTNTTSTTTLAPLPSRPIPSVNSTASISITNDSPRLVSSRITPLPLPNQQMLSSMPAIDSINHVFNNESINTGRMKNVPPVSAVTTSTPRNIHQEKDMDVLLNEPHSARRLPTLPTTTAVPHIPASTAAPVFTTLLKPILLDNLSK